MKKTVCSEIDPNLPGIIILGHGPMPVAMLESAQFIIGNIGNADAFSLERDDSPEEFREAFLEAAGKYPKGAVIFADILGGTPSNQLLCASESMDGRLYAFAGVNLPLILDAVSLRTDAGAASLMERLAQNSTDYICNLTKIMQEM